MSSRPASLPGLQTSHTGLVRIGVIPDPPPPWFLPVGPSEPGAAMLCLSGSRVRACDCGLLISTLR